MPVLSRLADALKAPRSPRQATVWTLLACGLTTVLARPLIGILDPANMVMLFLLTVLLVAVWLGRNAAILASLVNVVLFDVFFVPPHFSLAVSNLQYLVTFAVMLATGLVTAHLAAGLRQRAEEAAEREQRTRALYETARQLAGALSLAQVEAIARAFVREQVAGDARVLWLPEAGGPAESPAGDLAVDPAAIEQTLATSAVVDWPEAGPQQANRYVPLAAPMRVRGVLALHLPDALAPETRALVDALAPLLAIAIERLHYVEVAQASQLETERERLRGAILSALSHDLRTPLTALGGLAESLFLIKPALPAAALETAQTLHEQATRLASRVGNLLDMARLSAGNLRLRREWQPLEEVIGASIQLLGPALAGHPVRVHLPPDLPWLEFDAVLLERVFCNLLDNAAKYAPTGSPIVISAVQRGPQVEVSVSDAGPGPGAADPEAWFEPFERGQARATPGSGLGLAICRAILAAHGGDIHAEAGPQGGTRVFFRLPVGTPPRLTEIEP